MRIMKSNRCIIPLLALLTLNAQLPTARAQGTAFTYQGRLNSSGASANGLYDFRFRLASDPLANNYVGNPYLTNGIPVTNGLFITTMDFGPGIFAGSNYWLEVDVRTNGAGSYTVLSPLQALTPTPYAIFANSASNLLGVLSAAQLSGAVANGNLPSSPTISGTVTAGSFSGNGANVTNVNAAALNGLTATNFWQTAGNGGTSAGLNYLGTKDNQPLEIHVNGQRAFRLEPNNTNAAPNVLAGSAFNYVVPGVEGATISGGGATNAFGASSNSVTANYGTIGGGINNIAGGGPEATVGGGVANSANNAYATVAGGFENNASGVGDFIGGGGYSPSPTLYPNGNSTGGNDSVVAGGVSNHANDDFAVVGGGVYNTAGNFAATASGGYHDVASGQLATVGGGLFNVASGGEATVPGGQDNLASGLYSFAAGYFAQATNDGTFVWADSQGTTFASTGTNQFLIRAGGGVGIGTATPGAQLDVAGASGTAIRVTGPAGGGSTVAYDLATYNPGTNAPGARILATDDGVFSASLDLMTKVPGAITNPLQSRLHITSSGNVSIGVGTPGYILDVGGRIRLRQESLGNSAGMWLYQNDTGNDRGFVGLENDAYLGLWGNPGAIWGLVMNVTNGFVGIGNPAPSTYLQVVNATCNGSSWVNASDRNLKQNFMPVNAADVLAKVVALPVQSWDYKAQPGEKHIGPVAQDFHAAFGLNGADERHIATVDESGVALAAIQGLNQKLESERAENAELKARLAKLESLVQQLAQERK